MSSGGRGPRGGNKGHRSGGGDHRSNNSSQNSSNSSTSTQNLKSGESHNSDKKDGDGGHKIAPTAEQLRIAQMIDNTRTEPDKVLQEKMSQVMQFCGVSGDDALVALHDCDNDVNAAIESLLEGDDQGKWQESTKKKKTKNTTKQATENESNKENRRVDSRERSGSRSRGGGPPRFRGRGGGAGRGGRDGGGGDSYDAPGRGREGSGGGSSRGRGRMMNGAPGSARGRGAGGRGRGGRDMGQRTFQNRTNQGFPDTIDNWGPPPHQDKDQNALKIDNWDEDPTPATGAEEDWNDDWSASPPQPDKTNDRMVQQPAHTAKGNYNWKEAPTSATAAEEDWNDDWSASPPQPDKTNDKMVQQPAHTAKGNYNWDEEPATGGDDWADEWTGSLEKTTVFGNSTATNNGPTPNLPDTLTSPPGATDLGSMGGPPQTSGMSTASVVSSGPGPAMVQPQQQQQPQQPPQQQHQQQQQQQQQQQSPQPQSYSNATASTASITQPQTMDLAALLQKAAPQSTLTGLVSSSALNAAAAAAVSSAPTTTGPPRQQPTMPMQSGGSMSSQQMFGGLSGVGESLKSVNLVGASTASAVPSAQQPNYSTVGPANAQLQAAIFSSSGLHSGVANSMTNSMSNNSVASVNKSGVPLGSQSSSLTSRPRTQKPRLPQASKIPQSAVEMPEDAMAALDIQFSGLEFGTDTYDFTADVKTTQPPVPGGLTSASSMNSRVDPASTPPTAAASKDLTTSSLPSSLTQTQKLGPEPIPYPSSQSSERSGSSSGGGSAGGGYSSSGGGVGSAGPAPGLADLTNKNDGSAGAASGASGTGGLGGLVGSTGSTYQTSYSSKPTSFPSPPSASSFSQTQQQNSYVSSNSVSSVSGSSVSSSSYSSSNQSQNSNSSSAASVSQGSTVYGNSYSPQTPTTSVSAYQNSYVNASSHSSLGSITGGSKTLQGLSPPSQVKDNTQSYGETTSTGVSGLSSTMSTSVASSSSSNGSNNAAAHAAVALSTLNSASTHQSQINKTQVPGKSMSSMGSSSSNSSSNSSVPPGVQQHPQPHMQQQPQQQQQQQAMQHQQQQQQQQQQAQQMMAQHSQYVSPPAAALQGALPPAFYTAGLQQPMYSLEDFQMLQQGRMPHMAPSTLAGRDASMTSAAYSVSDAKFRTDQNSSPVPSTMNQQGAAAGQTYITATGNAAMPPYFMYHNMAAVPSSFPQYGAPTAIIQIPPTTNVHTGSNTNQFPAAPKLQYQTANYYDNLSQTQDFKTSYGTGNQSGNKAAGASAGTGTNSATDLGGYKNHLSKSYDKQGFHTGTPPPFNLAGSGANAMTASYTPMFIPTMPQAQHHSPLMHHQLHQDGGSSGGQRTGASGGQNKGGSKAPYGGSYWGSN